MLNDQAGSGTGAIDGPRKINMLWLTIRLTPHVATRAPMRLFQNRLMISASNIAPISNKETKLATKHSIRGTPDL